jgi:hypothetical protein
VGSIDLLVEGLGVERAGGAGGTGDHQQSNESGRDGLHGYLSSDHTLPAARAGVSVLFHTLVRTAVTEGTTSHHSSRVRLGELSLAQEPVMQVLEFSEPQHKERQKESNDAEGEPGPIWEFRALLARHSCSVIATSKFT